MARGIIIIVPDINNVDAAVFVDPVAGVPGRGRQMTISVGTGTTRHTFIPNSQPLAAQLSAVWVPLQRGTALNRDITYITYEETFRAAL